MYVDPMNRPAISVVNPEGPVRAPLLNSGPTNVYAMSFRDSFQNGRLAGEGKLRAAGHFPCEWGEAATEVLSARGLAPRLLGAQLQGCFQLPQQPELNLIFGRSSMFM